MWSGDPSHANDIVVEVAHRRDDVIGLKAKAQLGAFASFLGDVPRQVAILEGLGDAFLSHEEPEWAARSFANYGWGMLQLGRARESLEPLQESRRLWLELGSPEMASQPLNHQAVAYAVLARPSDALAAIRLANADRAADPPSARSHRALRTSRPGRRRPRPRPRRPSRSATSRDRDWPNRIWAGLSYTVGRYEQAVESAVQAVALLTEVQR